jgi:hypothetical protein
MPEPITIGQYKHVGLTARDKKKIKIFYIRMGVSLVSSVLGIESRIRTNHGNVKY